MPQDDDSKSAAEENWQEKKYRAVFEEACAHLAVRRRMDPTFTLAELEGLLRTAYINEGNNWTGRGVVHEITQSATIAALEHTLAEWRAERKNPADAPGGEP